MKRIEMQKIQKSFQLYILLYRHHRVLELGTSSSKIILTCVSPLLNSDINRPRLGDLI